MSRASSARKFFAYRNGEQGKHEFVMAGKRDAGAAGFGGTLDHISARAILLHEVHIRGGEVAGVTPEVARQVESLEKDLGHDHGGAEIQHDAAREGTGYRGESMEVIHGRGANRATIGGWMHMRDVRAERDVHGGWSTVSVCGGEDAGGAKLEPGAIDLAADNLSQPLVLVCRQACRAI